MALIPPFFADCVVAIGYERDGKVVWAASGFFYCHSLSENEGHVYLVTNKHVLEGKDWIYIRVNPKALNDPKGYKVDLVSASGEQLWMGHRHKSVDVAVIPIKFQLLIDEGMQVSYFVDTKHSLDTTEMKSKGVSEGDNVFALGYPVSLVGDKSNSVIIRGGMIARLRDTLASPEEPFLIDTTVFPGNSGGPVINRPESLAIAGTQAVLNANLIGIIASYVSYRDFAVSRQTGNVRVIFEENSGLSNVFSVDCIRSVTKGYERKLKKSKKLATPEPSKEASEVESYQDVESSY